jgi:Leucine-rich repeat (LRR) protein
MQVWCLIIYLAILHLPSKAQYDDNVPYYYGGLLASSLELFYTDTGGDSWSRNDNWNDETREISVWFGLTGDSNGRVLSMDLDSNNLDGSINEGIGSYFYLSFLDLSANSITGTIPDSMIFLHGLTYLSLSSNSLTGTLPPRLSELTLLGLLAVSSNSLSGCQPTMASSVTTYSYLPQTNTETSALTDLYSATAGSSWTDNTGWETDSDINNWYGISAGCGSAEVTAIQLATNNLAGTIPDSIRQLTHLTILSVSHNAITGTFVSKPSAHTLHSWDMV